MTPKEHLLMISLVAKQLQLIRTLTEILQSRGLLDEGDFHAFDALVRSDRSMSEKLLNDASEIYLKAATSLGIDVQPADA